MKKLTDQEIIALLKTRQKDVALNYIYKSMFPNIKRNLITKGASIEDTKDLFQEAVLQLYIKIIEGKFIEEEANIFAFLNNIAKNKWIDKIRRDKKIEVTDDFTVHQNNHTLTDASSLLEIINSEKSKLVEQILSSIGEKCQQLLKLVIFQNYSMKEIAEELGFSNEDSAKTQHYKCKAKLIHLYKKNDHIKQTLTESNYE